MVRAIDMKYKATGPLADIVGTRAMKRGQMMKKSSLYSYMMKETMTIK